MPRDQEKFVKPSLDALGVLARFKAVTGSAKWNEIHSLRESGTMSAGSLQGACEAIYDIATGRSARAHQLGSMTGAGGYDGRVGWQRGPAGEIAILDAPQAQQRARSQAWLDGRGFVFPEMHVVQFGNVGACDLNGVAHVSVEVTPDGGEPLSLWFECANGLLTRIVRQRGVEQALTTLDDYRDVQGLLLPHRVVSERVNALGASDSRQRVQIELLKVDLNVPLADARFSVPAMTGGARIDDDSGFARVPFSLINNHIYVDGQVDGRNVRFMVDTGGVNLLTPAAASRLGLTGQGRLAASGPGERRVDVAMTQATQVRVGAATLDNPVFYIVDLAQLPQAEGVELDGLIGYEMFRRFGVEIDYVACVLTLSEPDRFVAPVGAEAFTLEFERLTPIVSGTLDGVPVRLTVDTGSRAALTLAPSFVREHNLVEKYRAAAESVLGWGVGGGVRMRAARLGRLQLGSLAIEAIAGDLFTGTGGALAQMTHAGNLGGGVLRRFTVAFDYALRRLYLKPNANFTAVDDFDRSGLWLLQEPGALHVFDVAPGSAAQRAGIVAGDRVLAVDGTTVEAKPLAFWRALLRSPRGIEIALVLRRDGQVTERRLVLAERIPATWSS